jgi:hypothetical protein
LSSTFLKKDLPVVLVFFTGVVMIAAYFVQAPEIALNDFGGNLSLIASVIASYATILGIVSIIIVHVKHLSKRTKGQWVYSIELLVLMLAMIVLGLIGTMGTHPYFVSLYQGPLMALDMTIYSLLAFYIASAAFRAFKVKSTEGLILAVAGIFVMLMNAPVGAVIWPGFPPVGRWIMDVPSSSAFRGFIISASVGAVAVGLRVLIGRERTALGGT